MDTGKSSAFGVTILATLMVGIAGCSNIRVASQKDPQADLASLRTFEWQRSQPGGQPNSIPNSIIDTQIEKAVETELGRIGIEPVSKDGHPDFIISHNSSVLSVVTPRSTGGVGVGMAGTRAWGPHSVGITAPLATHMQTSEQGTVALSFIDPQRNQEIWHATATGRLDRSNRDGEKIQNMVQKMIREFEDARGKV